MADNVLALLQHLSSPASPLPSLTTGYKKPSTVFYTHLGHFWVYSFNTAKAMHTALFICAITLVYSHEKSRLNSAAFWKHQMRAASRVLAGLGGALTSANIVAAVMSRVLGCGMSWFSNEFSALALFSPPALFGTQLDASKRLFL
jgi:hypothetical protein